MEDKPSIDDDFPVTKDYVLEILVDNWELRKALEIVEDQLSTVLDELDAVENGRNGESSV